MRIIPLQTGLVRVKTSQRVGRGTGLAPQWHVLTDSDWTPWLPILAWLIDHPDGPIVVDTGETAHAMRAGYFPRWHPYFRRAVETRVTAEEEIGPLLVAAGVSPREVQRVVLTHLHTDHAGGLAHFPAERVWVHAPELAVARGWPGRLRGYLPNRWPRDFAPQTFTCPPAAIGAFTHTFPLTSDGRVTVVATPGHTRAHISVLVRDGAVDYLLAGDMSYTQDALLMGTADGVSPDPTIARATLATVRAYAAARPLVYLPSHDPDSPARLAAGAVVQIV